jgi:hypothetical protein
MDKAARDAYRAEAAGRHIVSFSLSFSFYCPSFYLILLCNRMHLC